MAIKNKGNDMAEDNFEKFKKRYEEGKAKVQAIPPPIPPIGGAASAARAVTGVVAKRGKDIVEGLTKAAKEPTKKAPRQQNAERPLNAGAKRLQGKMEKWRQEGAKTRNQSKPTRRAADEGTTAGRIRATAKRERTPREREQFGPLVPRRSNVPATQGTRAVTVQSGGQRAVAVREAGRRDMVPYKAQGRSVATRTFGDKGQGRITPRPSATGRVASTAPGASVAVGMATQNAPNLGAGNSLADGRSDTGKRIIYDRPAGPNKPKKYKWKYNAPIGPKKPAEDSKPSAGGDVPRKTDRKPEKKVESKSDAFRKKRQGMNTPGSPTYAGPKKAGKATDKSRVAKPVKKMTNFERMKMRGYEKEGVAGRSVTSKGAKARVMKERSYKFSDFFK